MWLLAIFRYAQHCNFQFACKKGEMLSFTKRINLINELRVEIRETLLTTTVSRLSNKVVQAQVVTFSCECSEAPTWRGLVRSPRFTYLHAMRSPGALSREGTTQHAGITSGRRKMRPVFKRFLLRRLRISGYVIGSESTWTFLASENQRRTLDAPRFTL